MNLINILFCVSVTIKFVKRNTDSTQLNNSFIMDTLQLTSYLTKSYHWLIRNLLLALFGG